ncbi:DUF1292 domain-containing protein [Gorillibacterium massiliense]|uniref:DUF1292 domain-containing protein n=1 Tax=Gorillibacterium massiliense TaxID=1280390 RepID=UPI0004B0E6A9|nr:DUF1292 domain-containing protein [Gorillibacterium massiliense]
MAAYALKDVVPLQLLKDAFGDEIKLEDDGTESQPYRILAEFSVGGGEYAILQSAAMQKHDEVEVFRIERESDGTLQLSIVEDNDAWEDLVELYDEMTVSFE